MTSSLPLSGVRPVALYPVFKPLTSVDGVGEKIAELMKKFRKETVRDILWSMPHSVLDRGLHAHPDLTRCRGQVASFVFTPRSHAMGRGQSPDRLYGEQTNGQSVVLVFFNGRSSYINQILPMGKPRIISGVIDLYDGIPQVVNPDFILPLDEHYKMPAFQPLYALSKGISQKLMLSVVHFCLKELPSSIPEWLTPECMLRHRLPSWRDALYHIHKPLDAGQSVMGSPERNRLAYDELLAHHLRLGLLRKSVKKQNAPLFKTTGKLCKPFLKLLPFSLTSDQKTVISEIQTDLASGERMFRLLQGDVGSGKTVVAFMAMLSVMEKKGQAALMAPTEILARQHFGGLAPYAQALGLRLALLTGREKGRKRLEILEDLAKGNIHGLIGTHALIEEDVSFQNLALSIIDEQHRFGVEQRLALSQKSDKPVHILVMSATPIPRTLSLAAYGEMDLSIIRQKPAGRLPIITRVVPLQKLGAIIEGLHRQIQEGARVYWVCPLVEESEKSDLAAAQSRFESLANHFGANRVRLIHGRMKATQKDEAMADFAQGRADILVATTVIEVGVNVPEATVMMIENAQRFGLAQLHQLRGRVGRGQKASSCLLLYSYPLTDIARQRLEIMRETEDGFILAEKDLQLRGAGEILGKRQSGLPVFTFSDPSDSLDLQEEAFKDARSILDNDPHLTSPRGEALQYLMHLFSNHMESVSENILEPVLEG